MGAWQTRQHPRGPLPTLQLRTLTGEPVSSASWLGKPVLLEVWAPWCGVCRLQADNVSRVRRWLGDQVAVVSVVTAFSDAAEIRTAMASHGVDYPVLVADAASLQKLEVSAFPTFFMVDANGRVVTSAVGYTTTVGLYLRARRSAW